MGAPSVTSIKLKYVQRYRDRFGKLRHYFRRKGQAKVALPGEPGSDAFMSAYARALDGQKATPTVDGKPREGSLAALAPAYYASSRFKNLSGQSPKNYRIVLDPLVREHGHKMVKDLRRRHVLAIVQKIGEDRPAMANLTLSALGSMLSHAVDLELIEHNPTARIKR
jgi:hypothetical protein